MMEKVSINTIRCQHNRGKLETFPAVTINLREFFKNTKHEAKSPLKPKPQYAKYLGSMFVK